MILITSIIASLAIHLGSYKLIEYYDPKERKEEVVEISFEESPKSKNQGDSEGESSTQEEKIEKVAEDKGGGNKEKGIKDPLGRDFNEFSESGVGGDLPCPSIKDVLKGIKNPSQYSNYYIGMGASFRTEDYNGKPIVSMERRGDKVFFKIDQLHPDGPLKKAGFSQGDLIETRVQVSLRMPVGTELQLTGVIRGVEKVVSLRSDVICFN